MKKALLKIVKICFTFLFIFGIVLYSCNLEKINAAEVYPFNGIIHADALVIHVTPDTKASSAVTQLIYGTRIKVIGEVNGLYKISYDNGLEGYVSKGYVTNVDANYTTGNINGVESYSNYCNSLKSGGFPESYCPYLYHIHGKHPGWTFRADVIDETLDKIVYEESSNKRNVLQTTNKNYFLDQSLNPIEGDYYYINGPAVASFMDPRNSLFETRLFQFLDLQSTKAVGNDAAMLKVTGNNGFLKNYINEFKEAANTYGVNPIHLIGRSLQEGANNATYSSVAGLYTTTYGKTSSQGYSLDGYYNFFNIGAYAGGYYTGTVQRGLAYAAGFLADDNCMSEDENGKGYYDEAKCGVLLYSRPWNTPAKAINGGANFLNETYTKKGQDTIFYEKFNVSSYTTNTRYTHQYMTNAVAPASEAVTMFNAYNVGGLMGTNFNFIIPVYKNMPAEPAQAVNKSSNNKLSSLKINDVLVAGFDRDVVEYRHNLTTNSVTFKVTATALDSKASISGVGDYTFNNGVAQVNVTVTAENGDKATYRVNVNQIVPIDTAIVKASDVVSKMAVKIDGSYMYGINNGTVVSTIVNTAMKNGGTAKVVDKNGKAKTTGSMATGDKVTISGTKDSLTYTVAVRGDVNGDGTISLSDFTLIQSHLLKKLSLNGEKFYAADINFDGKISLSDFTLVQSHLLKKLTL